MKAEYSSERYIKLAKIDPNGQISDNQSEKLSSTSNRQISQKQSNIGKNRLLLRKPNTQNSNLQSYKLIKRKSQQKLQNTNLDGPPKYPKAIEKIIQNNNSVIVNSIEQKFGIQSESIIRQSNFQHQNAIIKFKKKGLSKKQIIEIKDYIEGLQFQESKLNTVSRLEEQIRDKEDDVCLRQLNKKSKTEYFNFQEIHRQLKGDVSQISNYSQNDMSYIIQLRQRCKTVDDNNSLLHKRLGWLREQVQMYLQKQLQYERQRKQYDKNRKDRQNRLRYRQQQLLKQRQQLIKQMQYKNIQIQQLKLLYYDISNKFQNEKQIIIQQNNLLRIQIGLQVQNRLNIQQNIQLIQQSYNQLIIQKQLIENNINQSIMTKILNQNKYLKIQNHILNKYKQDLKLLEKEFKKISNQRDNLKKKIIQSTKKKINRYCQEQSLDSQLFLLSQISNPSS